MCATVTRLLDAGSISWTVLISTARWENVFQMLFLFQLFFLSLWSGRLPKHNTNTLVSCVTVSFRPTWRGRWTKRETFRCYMFRVRTLHNGFERTVRQKRENFTKTAWTGRPKGFGSTPSDKVGIEKGNGCVLGCHWDSRSLFYWC